MLYIEVCDPQQACAQRMVTCDRYDAMHIVGALWERHGKPHISHTILTLTPGTHENLQITYHCII